MQPKSGFSDQGDLFRSRLDQILNRQHPLYRLADSIDWSLFDKDFGTLYVKNFGRPGLPIRFLVDLYYLNHDYNVSDEPELSAFWKISKGNTFAAEGISSTQFRSI